MENQQNNTRRPQGGQRFYRGQGRSRGQFTSSQFRGNQQNRGSNQYPNRGSNQYPRRGQNNTPRTNTEWENSPRNHGARKYVLPSHVNVGPASCLKCGDTTHRFQDSSCRYYSSPLYGSACPKCRRGGHAGRLCQEAPRGYLGSNARTGGYKGEYVNTLQEYTKQIFEEPHNAPGQLTEDECHHQDTYHLIPAGEIELHEDTHAPSELGLESLRAKAKDTYSEDDQFFDCLSNTDAP